MKRSSLITSLICFSAASSSLWSSQTLTWNGSGSNLWGTNTNWTPNSIPNNCDELIFDATGGFQNPNPCRNNLTSTKLFKVKFTGGNYTITGNTSPENPLPLGVLEFTGASGSVTWDTPITTTSDPCNPSFVVIANGDILFSTNGSTEGRIEGAVALVKEGTAQLQLDRPCTYSGGTTIKNGTLRGQVIPLQESLQGSINIEQASAILLFQQSVNGTFTGAISGPGVTRMVGTGTITFTGTNTNSGLTLLINAGLKAGGVNVFSPNGSYNVSNIATLDLNSFNQTVGSISGTGTINLGAATLTTGNDNRSTFFDGPIAAPPSNINARLTKVGTGTFTLGGDNTYSYFGDTTISGGTLQAGGANVFSPNSLMHVDATLDLNNFNQLIPSLTGTNAGSIVLGSAALTLGDTASRTYLGTMSGTGGALIKIGAGTFSMFGVNTYTGGTTVNAGTLEGNTLSLNGNITINNLGTLQFNETSDSTFNGTMSGTGTLTKVGSGILRITTPQLFTGPTSILAGTLAVNATLPSSITIGVGATMQGTGTVDNVTNNGLISPGNSIGTIVTGNYVQSATGIYLVQFDNAGAQDLIQVTGTATLDGTLLLGPLTQELINQQQSIILTAVGGVSGTFATIDKTLILGRLVPVVIYEPNQVILAFFVKAPLDPCTGGANSTAVANYINNLPFIAGSDLDDIFDQLSNLECTQLGDALYKLQPSFFGTTAIMAQETQVQAVNEVLYHLSSLHGARCLRHPDKRMQVWADYFGQFTHQKHFFDQTKYHSSSNGTLMGIDSHIIDTWYIGLFGESSKTQYHWGSGVGHGHFGTYGGGLYTTWAWKKFFVDAVFAAARSSYENTRSIHFGNIYRHAKSSTEGVTYTGNVQLGWNALNTAYLLQPFMDVGYIYSRQDGFKEHGAQSLDLKVSSTDSKFLRSELGLNFAYCTTVQDFRFSPYIKTSYVRESRFGQRKYNSKFVSFENVASSLESKTANPSRSLLAQGIGFTASHADNFCFMSAAYEYETDFSKFFENNVVAELNFSF